MWYGRYNINRQQMGVRKETERMERVCQNTQGV